MAFANKGFASKMPGGRPVSRYQILAALVGLLPAIVAPALAADLDDFPPVVVAPVAVPVPVPVPVLVPIFPFCDPAPVYPPPTLFTPPVYYPRQPRFSRAATEEGVEIEHYGYGRARPPIAQLGYYGPRDVD